MVSHQFRQSILIALLVLAMATAAKAVDLDASALLRAEKYQQLDAHYADLQRQFSAGHISGDQLRDAFRAFYPTDADLAVRYDAWIDAYPKSYVARLARGIYYKKIGLEERGGNYISETSQTQIEKMDNALRLAARDFGASIALDSKPFLSFFHTMDIGRQYVSNEDSRKIFDRAAALDPNSFGLRLKFMTALQPRWGGSTQAMREFFEESKKTKLTAANLNELESMVYREEGDEFRANGTLPAAEAAYRKAIALGPCECGERVYSNLNSVLFETGQYDAAIMMLNEYLKQNPGNSWALANRGMAFMNTKRSREAIEDWEKAADAGDSYSQKNLGLLFLHGGVGVNADPLKSVSWLRKAAQQGDGEAQMYLPIAERMATDTAPAK